MTTQIQIVMEMEMVLLSRVRLSSFPISENVSTLSVPLLGGKFYSSSSCVEVWNGLPGSSGIVESSSWWNYQFNQPQSINPGDNNLQPQFDFVFDYSCGENPFELSVLFSGGFELFDISNLPWSLGLSNKNLLLDFHHQQDLIIG